MHIAGTKEDLSFTRSGKPLEGREYYDLCTITSLDQLESTWVVYQGFIASMQIDFGNPLGSDRSDNPVEDSRCQDLIVGPQCTSEDRQYHTYLFQNRYSNPTLNFRSITGTSICSVGIRYRNFCVRPESKIFSPLSLICKSFVILYRTPIE